MHRLLWVALACQAAAAVAAETAPDAVHRVIAERCLDCHQGSEAAAGLDLQTLSRDLSLPGVLEKWVAAWDRVQAGEMPPADAEPLPKEQAEAFLAAGRDWLAAHQRREYDTLGRVRGRRLTNLQLERSLHDLLGIDIPLANQLPEEPKVGGFSGMVSGQSISHFQLERFLQIVDAALEEAFRRADSPPLAARRRFSGAELSRQRPRSRTREPELIGDAAVVWSGRVAYYGRLPALTARESGWYRYRIQAAALKPPADGGVWCSVRSGRCVSSAPLLSWVGSFEAVAEPRQWTLEAWIPQGDMLEIRPADATLRVGRFAGGQVGTGEGEPQDVPGVAIQWIEVERIHRGPDPAGVRRLLWEDADLDRWRELPEDQQREVAVDLLHKFARRAFRRPVEAEQLSLYEGLLLEALRDGADLPQALRTAYRAVLVSPRFLYFHELPGRLDDYALASRLSYFLWNRPPDAELYGLAQRGALQDPDVLRQQTRRMLADDRGRDFVRDLAADWLDLGLIDFTEPDRRLYPQFDPIVQNAMLAETQAFLQHLLAENLGVSHFIQSDFTFLNSRLARYYGVEGVIGDDLQLVALDPDSQRGGVLTQGAVLKVTANGTTTSPVIRGVWVSERLLGVPIPPPPMGVPAVEPDIRGATTIREMLAKHRSHEACNTCHVKIDPPGFALENYDPAGRWRTHYGVAGRRAGKARPVDASYELPDGRFFAGVAEFRRLIVEDQEQLARNFAEKLLAYGTGVPVQYLDRQDIEAALEASREDDYGVRTLVEAVVCTETFRRK